MNHAAGGSPLAAVFMGAAPLDSGAGGLYDTKDER